MYTLLTDHKYTLYIYLTAHQYISIVDKHNFGYFIQLKKGILPDDWIFYFIFSHIAEAFGPCVCVMRLYSIQIQNWFQLRLNNLNDVESDKTSKSKLWHQHFGFKFQCKNGTCSHYCDSFPFKIRIRIKFRFLWCSDLIKNNFVN